MLKVKATRSSQAASCSSGHSCQDPEKYKVHRTVAITQEVDAKGNATQVEQIDGYCGW